MQNKAAVLAFAAAVFFRLSAVFGAVFSPDFVSARETAAAASREAEQAADKIWKYEMEQAGASDYEEYLSAGLVPYAGEGTEWLFICLTQWKPELDFGEYDRALNEYLEENGTLKPVDYQRIAPGKISDRNRQGMDNKCNSGIYGTGRNNEQYIRAYSCRQRRLYSPPHWRLLELRLFFMCFS